MLEFLPSTGRKWPEGISPYLVSKVHLVLNLFDGKAQRLMTVEGLDAAMA